MRFGIMVREMLYAASVVALALMLLPAAAMVVVAPGEGVGGVTVDLIAGQHIDSGNVTVWVEGSILHVEYSAENGWFLGELHLAVASSLDEIPQTKKGNPIPGKFGWKAELSPESRVTSYAFEIPLDGLSGTIYIAAQAEVYRQTDTGVQEETAWGEGEQFPGSNWAMYFTYTIPG